VLAVLCVFQSTTWKNPPEALSNCTTYGMLWLTYEVTYCVFAIDHVLVSFVTVATTGVIFSLQFTKNRLTAGLRPEK